MLNEVAEEEQTDSSVFDDKGNRLSDFNNIVNNSLMLNKVADEEQADSSVVDSPNTFFSPSNNHPPKREKKQQFNLKSKISTMSSLQNFCCEKETVSHAHSASEDFFKGSVCESNWYFCHDALSFVNSGAAKD